MKRFLFVTLVAALVSAATLGDAAPARAAGAKAEPFIRPARFSSQDLTAFADARIAGLKAGLQLKPEQEKNWPALETALRDNARARIARVEEWRDKAPATFESDPIGALQRRARTMTARAGELDRLAGAAKPLYESLDDSQKRRFGALVKAAIAERAPLMRRMMERGGFGAGPD